MSNHKNDTIQFNTTSPDISMYFKEGGKLFLSSLPTFIIASLVFWLVLIFSFSIFAGPLIAGYMLIFVKKSRNESISPPDIFKGFGRFVPLVIAFYLTKILIAIGLFLLIIPGLILIARYIFVELIILDMKIGVIEAMKLNKKMVSKRGLWIYVIFNTVLVLILNLAGLFSFGIGYIILTPYVFSVYAVAYEDAFKINISQE
jgi:hypothetical protein